MEKINKNKKEEERVLNTIKTLEEVRDFIKRDDLKICTVTNGEPYGTDYVNKEGIGISEMTKFTGSKLSYLLNVINDLKGYFDKIVLFNKDNGEKTTHKSFNLARKYAIKNGIDKYIIGIENKIKGEVLE